MAVNIKIEPLDSDHEDRPVLTSEVTSEVPLEVPTGVPTEAPTGEPTEVPTVVLSDVKIEIKQEPQWEPEEEEPGYCMENVHIKVEPLSYAFDNENERTQDTDEDSEDDLDVNKPGTTKRKYRKRKGADADGDYSPDKRKKKKKQRHIDGEPNVKPAFRGKHKETTEHTYSEEVTKHIQILTITEEERKKEHQDILSGRTHCKYLCTNCALGFVVKEAYNMHMKMHSPEAGDNLCDICNIRRKTADGLYRHKLRHYRRYRCQICRMVHKDRDTVACHIMTQHEKINFTCSYCGKGFKRPQYLKGHINQTHTKTDRFECPVCQQVFHERSWYRTHVRKHNEEVKPTYKGSLSCHRCKRHFKSYAYFKRHMEVHEASPACATCYKQCEDRDALAIHMARVHGVQPEPTAHACPHCPRLLTSRGMLSRHIKRMHINRIKKFECDYCHRLYYTKSEVRSHIMWTHMRARGGHACHCGRLFRTPARLRDHRARMHAARPPPRAHACPLCDKAFQSKQLLTRHMSVHSDTKYSCSECDVTFKTQGYVRIHYMLKHLNMTRAEIKARAKPLLPVTVNSGRDLMEGNLPNLIRPVVAKVVDNDVKPPIPLFTTFVDVQKDIL